VKKLTALALLLVLLAGATAYVLYRRANEPFRGYPGAEQFVEIPPGAGTSGIGRRLIAAGVVSDQ
jgi:cell division protein YceG involved in septum cleavage